MHTVRGHLRKSFHTKVSWFMCTYRLGHLIPSTATYVYTITLLYIVIGQHTWYSKMQCSIVLNCVIDLPYSRKIWRWLKFGSLAVCVMTAKLKSANISVLTLYVYIRRMTIPYGPPNLNLPMFLFRRLWTKPPNLKTANISGYTVDHLTVCIVYNVSPAPASYNYISLPHCRYEESTIHTRPACRSNQCSTTNLVSV